MLSSCVWRAGRSIMTISVFENGKRGLKRGPIEGSAPTAVRITDEKVTYRYSDGATEAEEFKMPISSEKRLEFPV